MAVHLDTRALLLLVDDDARSANFLARLLREEGYDVEVTTDGSAAIARLTREPVPDLVMTELYLPLAGGLAVGRYARSRRARMPIFLVTGDADSAAKAVAGDPLDEPIVIVTKPLEYADLVRRLGVALRPAKGV